MSLFSRKEKKESLDSGLNKTKESLFAKISRYDFNGKRFYIMPRVKGIDEDRWEDAWYYMTDEETDWCLDHNLYDLHCKNYGLHNGKVTIFDYGAYDEEE